jgi:carbohydrate kinase (thermoresistant glucokinase family)
VIVIVMGVSGVGKTTIGEALARELGWRFLDADDYHPPQNVAKMAAGEALDDADRKPWLDQLNLELWKFDARDESAVLACSALKEKYRRRLTDGIKRVQLVFLKGEFELIHSRLAQRRHRFMPESLLRSQFEALEPPQQAITVEVSADVPACVAAIAARVR